MFIRPRLIPVLSIMNDDLVKTTQFSNPRYLGDPVNAVKIFNGKMVDELCILDITASKEEKEPNFALLRDIAAQAFMPLSYGGGLTSMEQVKQIIQMGYEKVVFNSSLFHNPSLIKDAVSFLGSSGVVASIDVRKGKNLYNVYTKSGTKKYDHSLEETIEYVQQLGVGEIIINSIDNEGMMNGYDEELIKITSILSRVPVIANGGAGEPNHFRDAIQAGAQASAASSFFVFYGKQKTVLITHPSEIEIVKLWEGLS
jgi:imidazole glycerol-phosphate synthase subunit HisF